MKINILLPHKEKFDKKKASSVSITIRNNMSFSKFKKDIIVFGQVVNDPIYPKNFFGVEDPKWFFKSKNKNIAKKMCKKVLDAKLSKQLIEIHNRPHLINYIFKKVIDIPIILFLHNDPQTMKETKTVKQRKKILSQVKLILCVSNFIKEKFLDGIDDCHDKVLILYNGVTRFAKSFPSKKKSVLFVGRIVPDKGVHLYVNAVSQTAKKFPGWTFYIIGSTHLGENTLFSKFSKLVVDKFNKIGKQAKYSGFLNFSKVQKIMQSASIIVIPSTWAEPYGLVVSEAMSNGIAIITSNVGGIPEVLNEGGILIENINEEKIIKELIKLMNNPKKLKSYQKLAWNNFSHTSLEASRNLDGFRQKLI